MDDIKIAAKLKEASDVINSMSRQIEKLTKQNSDLLIENKRLTLRVIASERSKRAVDLAEQMVKKGMIPKSELEHKAREIMDYNDEGYNIMKEAVELRPDIPEKSSFTLESLGDKVASSQLSRAERSKQIVEEKVMSSIKP